MLGTDTLPVIRQLSTSVVNKIAAGEVIERPASVLKELLENAVDARATRIDVVVEKGGIDLVRITDNGCGMTKDQLPLAIATHATSKIITAEDLFHVSTLGFRGEALASIAEVSQFTIRSRIGADDGGHEIVVNGGSATEPAPCGCPVGTSVEVRNLFFNTPVRRKFLRTTQTEMGHCLEAFTRIAVSYPEIHFTLKHNDKMVHELAPTDDWKQRIAVLFGHQVADSLIRVSSEDGPIRLSGYVANPDLSRGNNKMQYLFLNGRHIRDRSLQHALSEAFRGLLLHGRYPVCFLRMEMPSEQVDVNVHPTKLEVRFQEGGKIYSQLLGTLRTRFLSTDLTSRVQGTPSASPAQVTAPNVASQEAAIDSGMDPSQTASVRNQFVEWARGAGTNSGAGASGGDASSVPGGGQQTNIRFDPPTPQMPLPHSRPIPQFRPFNDGGATNGFPAGATRPNDPRDVNASGAPSNAMPQSASGSSSGSGSDFDSDAYSEFVVPQPNDGNVEMPAQRSSAAPHPYGAIQAHNRYLITESEDGIVVIDQHALHERIIYEEIRDKVVNGHLETQRLLVPETVDLTPQEAAAVLQSHDLLKDMGIEIEDFGNSTVLVSSYPAMIANMNPGDLIRQVAEQLVGHGKAPDRRDLMDELLHMISCKAAVKAGDKLSAEEIQALIERRHLVQDSHHCPHGRPTTLVFTRDELDKRFKRT